MEIKPLYNVEALEGANQFDVPPVSEQESNEAVELIESNTSWVFLGRKWIRSFGFILVFLALIIGAASFVILLGLTSVEPSKPWVTLSILIVNGILVSLLLALIVREAIILLNARKKGRAAARLHIRIVGLFSLVAALPAILVAIVAGFTLDVGLDRWFEERTRSIVDSAVSVGESYLQESARGLTGSSIAMASEIERARQLYSLDRTGFQTLLTNQARGRGMIAARVMRKDGTVLVSATLPREKFIPSPREDAFIAADKGTPAYIPPGNSNFVGNVIKLDNYLNSYLYTVRQVNPSVMKNRRLMQDITNDYNALENNRLSQQIAFALLYFGICLIVLLSAIWTGLSVADKLVDPIRNLIGAAAKVSSGKLDVEVEAVRAQGDMRDLTVTFNEMTKELRQQRNRLVSANNLIDQRRRFTETVLSGVSAGVVGLSRDGTISIFNRVASEILKHEDETLEGKNLRDIQPQLAASFDRAVDYRGAEFLDQIHIIQNAEERTLNVQVTREGEGFEEASYVITFDDITELVSAQRTSAWADVARRIAHEIKNPLTPIQLSAERIRRRYGKVITKDREVFDQCTDTIIRQVSDIGRMVDEFSSFARMPKPTMERGDLGEHIKEAFFLQEVSNPHIKFNLELGDKPLVGLFDKRLLGQAFTNIIKNAAEAIEGFEYEDGEKGQIDVIAKQDEVGIIVDVVDNGKGLPVEGRQRLLEPYMTTRSKGTGLGLAIVSKVFEDHGGSIELLDSPQVATGGHGALVRLHLPNQAGLETTVAAGNASEIKNG